MPLTTPLPADFVRLIQQLLPEEAEALLGALEGEASVSVRRNAAKCAALPSELPLSEPVAWSQGLGYYLSRASPPIPSGMRGNTTCRRPHP